MMRHMYYDAKHLDLNVLRKQAIQHSKGDSRNAPVPVTIHYHKRTQACHGQKHEDYREGKQVIK